MKSWQHDMADESQTAALAARLAPRLFDGAVLALDGPLGAGKTCFVRAVAAASGVDPRDVTSPTFVLVQEYAGRLPIHHFDVYRLRDSDEFLALGPEEHFAGGGWTAIEWSERVADLLPADRLDIRIAVTGPTSRQFAFAAHGPRHEQLLDELAASNPA